MYDLKNDRPAVFRIFRIWTPRLKCSIFEIILLSAGSLVVWAIGYVVAIGSLYFLLFDSDSSPPMWVFYYAIICGLVAVGLWAWWIHRRMRRRVCKTKRHRTNRLDNIVTGHGFRLRYPHRVLEHESWKPNSTSGQHKKLLLTLPNGSLVVANGLRLSQYPRPKQIEVPFEPIHVQENSYELLYLVEIALDGQAETPHYDSDKVSRSPVLWLRYWSKPIWAWFSILGYVFLCPVLLQRAFQLPGLIAGSIVSVLILWRVLGIGSFRGRDWWIVPGGIVCRMQSPARRNVRFRLFTPNDTPLSLDFRTGVATLVDSGRVIRFHFNFWTGWLMIASWFSTVRTPSLGEIELLLNSEAAPQRQEQPQTSKPDGSQ